LCQADGKINNKFPGIKEIIQKKYPNGKKDMQGRHPKVSVCIPTYNRATLLKQSIESVLGQTFSDYELIVSDNASQDETSDIVRKFKDDRITYIRGRKNIGLIKNFNNCLSMAKGDYITLFHDDDLMIEDNLDLKVRALDRDKNIGLVHSNFHIIDEKDDIREENAHFLGKEDFAEKGLFFLKKSLLGYNRVNAPSAMIRKECFLRLGGFRITIQFTTDFEYWMRIAMHYDVQYLGKSLIKYRMSHNNQWTSAKYFTVKNGVMSNNLTALQQEYMARIKILEQTKNVLGDWKNIRILVRKGIIAAANRLIESQYLKEGNNVMALRAIAQMCNKFPELFLDKDIIKIWLKSFLGLKITGAIKMAWSHR